MVALIYGYEGNPRTRIVLIVASFECIPYELVEVIPRKNIGKADYVAKFPLSHGKIPGIEEGSLRLTETIAIVTYLVKQSNRAGLLGDGSKKQEARVMSLMSWANQELLPTLALWFLPLIPGFTDPMPYNQDAVETGKIKSQGLLTTLEAMLDGKQWLVGDNLTLADIFVAVYVSRGLEWVLDLEWREAHPNIMNHFGKVTELETVRRIIPTFKLIKNETPNNNPYI